MRLLFFTRQLSVGGCQINAISLATALKRRGHQVMLIAESGPLVPLLEQSGIHWEPFDYMSRKHPSLDTMRALARVAKSHSIDIIQAFDPIPILEAYGSQWFYDCSVYGIITAQQIPQFRLARAREIALVNPSIRDGYIDKLGWSANQIRLITARLDCDRYRPIANAKVRDWAADDNVPTVTMVSRIDEGKWPTIELCLSAAAHWAATRHGRPLRFAFVGGGPRLAKLRERVVNLEGSIPLTVTGERLDIPDLMNASSIVLGMASTCQQGMACGRPVIVLGEQGYSEVLSPESFDFLASRHFNVHEPSAQDQPEALCAQLQRVLDDRKRARQLGDFGRQRALEYFDSSFGAHQLEGVYEQLINQSHPPLQRLQFWAELSMSFGSLYTYRARRWLQRRFL